MTQAAHTLTLRVYWEDTDAGGVVFYANYLRFFERARTEWLRSLGIEQQRLKDDARVLFVVASADLRYLAPARLDDVLDVDVRLVQRGRASLQLEQRACRGATPLALARVRIGCVGADDWLPRRLPSALVDALPHPPLVAA